MDKSTCVLLWSQSQNALHIETIEEMLEANRNALEENRRMDYVPIFIGSDDECHKAATGMRKVMHARDNA
jgi:hypothetical protein